MCSKSKLGGWGGPSRVRYDSQEQAQLSNTVFEMERQMMMLEGANMQANSQMVAKMDQTTKRRSSQSELYQV